MEVRNLFTQFIFIYIFLNTDIQVLSSCYNKLYKAFKNRIIIVFKIYSLVLSKMDHHSPFIIYKSSAFYNTTFLIT